MARDVIDAVLGRDAREDAPERHRRAPARRRGRRRTPWPGSPASSSTIAAVREVGPEAAARLVARHGTEAPAVVALGAELDLLRPLVAGPPVPRGRGRLGRPPRAGPVARRRPGAPDPAGPGAARSRRGDRPARRRDHRPPTSAGATSRQALEVDDVPRDGAARVLGRRRRRPPGRAALGDGADHDATERPRRTSSARHASRRHPRGAWSPSTTSSARSSTGCTRIASRSRSGRSSSRSSVARRRLAARAGSRRRGAIRDGRASCSSSSWPSGCRSAGTSPRRSGSGPSSSSPDPVAAVAGADARRPSGGDRTPIDRRRRPGRHRVASDAADARRRPRSPPRTVATGSFHGTDDFHFGRGTATIVETAPGVYTSASTTSRSATAPTSTSTSRPDADDYAKGALELGQAQGDRRRLRLRRCRQARTPPISPARSSGASSSRTSSRSRRWTPSDARDAPKVRYWQAWGEARTIPPVNATEGSVARYVARRNSDSSHG